jgi:hypothetical protein
VLEERLPGPIVPELLDAPEEEPARALPAPIEDAEELPNPAKATTG